METAVAKPKRGRPPKPLPIPPSNGDRAAWETATARKMEELVGRLLAKLEGDIKEIRPNQIPLAVAILTDKAALLSGRPTTLSATLTLKGNFDAEEIKARLTGKAPKVIKATAVDVGKPELGVGTQSVSSPRQPKGKADPSLVTVDPAAPYASEAILDMQSSAADTQNVEDQSQ